MRCRLTVVVSLVFSTLLVAPVQAASQPVDAASAAALAVPTCRRQHIPPVLANNGLSPINDYAPPPPYITYPAEGPCYYEVGLPPAGTPVKGAMLLVGGGGFYSSPNMVNSVQAPVTPTAATFKAHAQRWNAYGWITYSVEHSPQGLGVFDVRAFFDVIRAYLDGQPGYGPNFPVCTWGGSSGGHFALLVALMRPRVGCVVAEAAPNRLDQTTGVAYDIVKWAFTDIALPLPDFSPGHPGYLSPPNLTAPILLSHYRHDPVVGLAQTTGFVAGHPSAAQWALDDGTPTCLQVSANPQSCIFTTHGGNTLWSWSVAELRCREASMPIVVRAVSCLAPTPPPDLTTFAVPRSLLVPLLQTRTTTVGVVANAGLSGAVSLSAFGSGLALGSSVSISPPTVTIAPNGMATATVRVTSGLLQLSNFTVTVTATSGSATKSQTVPVAVR